jgi:drug/metabolite transporter (DMT)-like permease
MQSLGVLLALASALVWGGGDFMGGLAARRTNHLNVLALSTLSGVLLLLASALVWREGVQSLRDLVWAVPAGLSGAVGIANLYRGLSLGNASTVAPIAAVIGAALPVAVGAFTESRPSMTQALGFALAICGIWFVTSSTQADSGSSTTSSEGLRLAILAGAGFGGFFVFMARTPEGTVFLPLTVARVIGLLAGVLLIKVRQMPLPSLTSSPLAIAAGVFDASGGVFFVLAREWTRFDVAAVLSSLYPVSTVLLARLFQNEHVSRRQWLGVGLCLGAVGLMTL